LKAKKGDRVKVHYILKNKEGEIIETSDKGFPIEFTIGEGKMIKGVENGVVGMELNETRTITVPMDEAYGARDERKVFEFSRERAPAGFDPQIGQMVQMHRPDGRAFAVTVIGKTEKGFVMDANHPLAGKDLVFDLTLVEIANK